MNSAHCDLPTCIDSLNWNSEVSRMATGLRKCSTPHVVGVHGEWGSGKTSFMRQVQAALGARIDGASLVTPPRNPLPADQQEILDDEIVTVWFDAWRYQHEAVPAVALLHEMREQMSTTSKLREKFRKLGSLVTYGVLDSISDIGKIIGLEGLPNVEKIEKRAESWEKENYLTPLTTISIREKLNEAIDFLLPTERSRVIVFIDDLDRCSGKTAVKLLESLKIYFGIPRCVFVLGMNGRVLVDAIRDEIAVPLSFSPFESDSLHQIKAAQLRAGHYLEKICSDIFRIPVPSEARTYFSSFIEDTDQKVAFLDATVNLRCLPPNPRRIKALANQWKRFAEYEKFPENDVDKQKLWAARVLIASYIHQFHRDLWERWNFNIDFWNEILALCSGDRDGTKFDWARPLLMTQTATDYDEVSNTPKIVQVYSNPGDIDNFWIGSMIFHFRKQLISADFQQLLNRD